MSENVAVNIYFYWTINIFQLNSLEQIIIIKTEKKEITKSRPTIIICMDFLQRIFHATQKPFNKNNNFSSAINLMLITVPWSSKPIIPLCKLTFYIFRFSRSMANFTPFYLLAGILILILLRFFLAGKLWWTFPFWLIVDDGEKQRGYNTNFPLWHLYSISTTMILKIITWIGMEIKRFNFSEKNELFPFNLKVLWLNFESYRSDVNNGKLDTG